MGYTDKAVTAHLASTLHAGIHVTDGGKQVDITESDNNEHVKTQAEMGLPENVVAIWCYFTRMGGSGGFATYTEAGGGPCIFINMGSGLWFRSLDGDWRYKCTVANDDWDIYVQAYYTAGQLRG